MCKRKFQQAIEDYVFLRDYLCTFFGQDIICILISVLYWRMYMYIYKSNFIYWWIFFKFNMFHTIIHIYFVFYSVRLWIRKDCTHIFKSKRSWQLYIYYTHCYIYIILVAVVINLRKLCIEVKYDNYFKYRIY